MGRVTKREKLQANFKTKSSKSHSEKKDWKTSATLEKKGKEIKRVGAFTLLVPKKICINLFTSHHVVATKGEKKKRAASVQGGKMHIYVFFF